MVELLSELVPQAREVALLVSPSNPNTPRNIVDAQEAARAEGGAAAGPAGRHRKGETAFTSLAQSQSDALVIGGDPFFHPGATSSWRWHRAIVFRRSQS